MCNRGASRRPGYRAPPSLFQLGFGAVFEYRAIRGKAELLAFGVLSPVGKAALGLPFECQAVRRGNRGRARQCPTKFRAESILAVTANLKKVAIPSVEGVIV